MGNLFQIWLYVKRGEKLMCSCFCGVIYVRAQTHTHTHSCNTYGWQIIRFLDTIVMLFRPRSINVTFKTGDSTVLRTIILSLYLYWCRRQSHISGSIIRFLSFHRDSTNHIVQSRESLLVAFFSAILRIGRQIGNVTYKATVCQRIKTNANTRVQKKATQETMR